VEYIIKTIEKFKLEFQEGDCKYLKVSFFLIISLLFFSVCEIEYFYMKVIAGIITFLLALLIIIIILFIINKSN